MTTEIAKIISKLDNLMVMLEGIGYPSEDDTFFMHDIPEKHTDIKKMIGDICSDSDGAFIIGSGRLAGQPDFTRHAILKTESKGKYYITKGESDSWGWLSGKLCTPRGIIVYG
jgi:hypothetical protein